MLGVSAPAPDVVGKIVQLLCRGVGDSARPSLASTGIEDMESSTTSVGAAGRLLCPAKKIWPRQKQGELGLIVSCLMLAGVFEARGKDLDSLTAKQRAMGQEMADKVDALARQQLDLAQQSAAGAINVSGVTYRRSTMIIGT